MSDLEDDVEAGWDEEASPSQPQAVAPSQGARRLKRKSRAPAEQGGDAELEDALDDEEALDQAATAGEGAQEEVRHVGCTGRVPRAEECSARAPKCKRRCRCCRAATSRPLAQHSGDASEQARPCMRDGDRATTTAAGPRRTPGVAQDALAVGERGALSNLNIWGGCNRARMVAGRACCGAFTGLL